MIPPQAASLNLLLAINFFFVNSLDQEEILCVEWEGGGMIARSVRVLEFQLSILLSVAEMPASSAGGA